MAYYGKGGTECLRLAWTGFRTHREKKGVKVVAVENGENVETVDDDLLLGDAGATMGELLTALKS